MMKGITWSWQKTRLKPAPTGKSSVQTWSCWIFIDDLTYETGKYRCVFYKGNDYSSNPNNTETQGLNFPNNAPGLYIAPNTNDLVVFMNTFKVINEQVTISDIQSELFEGDNIVVGKTDNGRSQLTNDIFS